MQSLDKKCCLPIIKVLNKICHQIQISLHENYYLSSPTWEAFLNNSTLIDGSPSPSNRTSSPPMLLKWFWPRGLFDNARWRVHKVKYWSDKSVHCSFMLNLLMTRNNSEAQTNSVRGMLNTTIPSLDHKLVIGGNYMACWMQIRARVLF